MIVYVNYSQMPCQHWPVTLQVRGCSILVAGQRPPQTGHGSRVAINYTSIQLRSEGPVATITLDRAETGNLIDAAMAEEIRATIAELVDDDGLRLVILTAAGGVFSTGRTAVGDGEGQPLAALVHRAGELRVAAALAAVEVPVIAALSGDATDHGLELALAADLRVAVPGARFGFSPPSESSFPWDGGTQRLPRLVGPSWARDLLLTGRKVDAAEALKIGLVNRVAGPGQDLMEAATDLARPILEGSPLGARYAKEAVSKGLDLTLEQGLGLEADLNVILQSTADRAEGIASFLERRPPEFTGQ